jgi:hypothetical protein
MRAYEAMIHWTPRDYAHERFQKTRGNAMVSPMTGFRDWGEWEDVYGGAPFAFTDWMDPRIHAGEEPFDLVAKARQWGLRKDSAAIGGRWVLTRFVNMVVRDGIDPLVAHRELMDIDEYREAAGHSGG